MSYIKYRKHKILRYLDSLRNQWREFPPSLQIGLTDYCFNKCMMCGHWKRKDKQRLELQSLLDFLDIGKSLGLESVCYSGGDPFMYGEDLNSLMQWHVRNDMRFGFITAGFIPDNINLSLLSKAEWVRCSLDAIDSDIYEISRGGIRCDKVVESVKAMVSAGVNVAFGITIHNKNEAYIKEVFEFAISLKIFEIRVWVVRNVDGLEPNNKRGLINLLLSYKSYFSSLHIDNNFAETISILEFGEEQMSFDRCYACLFQLFIDAKGDIYPCCITAGDTEDSSNCNPLGNIYDEVLSWAVIRWRIDNFSKIPFKKLPEICHKNCILRLSTINHFAGKYWDEQNFI